MKFNKNGIIMGKEVIESSSNQTQLKTIKYYPEKGVINSCMDTLFDGLTPNEKYIICSTISWNFKSFPSNFGIWFQAPQKDSDGWGWKHPSNSTVALMTAIHYIYEPTFHQFVIKNPKYSKRVAAEFTVDNGVTGYGIGCRVDYGDGESWVEMRNTIVVPSKYYTGTGLNSQPYLQSIRVNESEIISENFIEC